MTLTCSGPTQPSCCQQSAPDRCQQDFLEVGSLSAAQVFADKRYQRHDKRDKLPGWITSHLKEAHLNLSTDMLMHIAREFMRSMAQPYDGLAIGKSLLTEAQANALSPQAAM